MASSSDFDTDSGDEASSLPEYYEDRETSTRTRQALGLTRSYVADWEGDAAFRELFQNMYIIPLPVGLRNWS